MKPGAPLLQSTRLLDQVRERIWCCTIALGQRRPACAWCDFFICWSATQPGGIRHPRDVGVQDVKAFLSVMANAKLASASNEAHTTPRPHAQQQRLVMAQGTGGAIVSAVRADFFTGWVTGVGF